MSSIDLDGLAHDVLAACVLSLDTIPADDATLSGSPVRAFVSPGEPVWDCCEQLVVYVPSVGEQDTLPGSQRRHVFGRIPMVRVEVTVSRCVPEGTVVGTSYQPPSIAALEASAAQIHADGWALHNGLFNRIAQNALSSRCAQVEWDGLRAAIPAGGCAGWTLELKFQLDGYGYDIPVSS